MFVEDIGTRSKGIEGGSRLCLLRTLVLGARVSKEWDESIILVFKPIRAPRVLMSEEM